LGLGAAASAWLQAPDAAALAADREWITRDRIQCSIAFASAIPAAAEACEGRAALLYVRGEVETLSLPQLAIVGSRSPRFQLA